MRVLVTGGAGFIGSNLCEALILGGHEVRCLDNLLTGHESNVLVLESNSNFKFILGDIRDLNTCLEAAKDCDMVVHLAALGSVPRSIQDPLTTHSININGFLNVLYAAQQIKAKRFVFAASSSTYGDSTELPKIEDRIGKPLSPYAVTKAVNEQYAHVFALNYGLPYIGLRYFNVFGKNQDPNGPYAAVIPKFIQDFLNQRSPLIHGDGSSTRDYTHVENVVHATMLAIECQDDDALNQIYNVAFGQRTSLIELCDIIKQEIAVKFPETIFPDLTFGPFRHGDIPHSLASIEKIKEKLGYEPKVSLSEGITKTIENFL